MRIRRYRPGDIPTLAHIQQQAAQVDGATPMSEADFEQWLAQPELQAASNVFLITDDDDDLNEWGQAGTLDGLEDRKSTRLNSSHSSISYAVFCLKKKKKKKKHKEQKTKKKENEKNKRTKINK